MPTKDSIRIAEAMGWKVEQQSGGKIWKLPNGGLESIFWNPLVDANADYAVLEWMRNRPNFSHGVTAHYMGEYLDYQIGDYARAALKVLENDG